MKVERAVLKQEFVPVIVTLESQEEVDSLYAVVDHTAVSHILPTLYGWQNKLISYRSRKYRELWEKLDAVIRHS